MYNYLVLLYLQVFLNECHIRCIDPTELGSFVASIRCTECEEDGGQVEFLLITNNEKLVIDKIKLN